MPRGALWIFAAALLLTALLIGLAASGVSVMGVALGVGTPTLGLGMYRIQLPLRIVCAAFLAASGTLAFLSVKVDRKT